MVSPQTASRFVQPFLHSSPRCQMYTQTRRRYVGHLHLCPACRRCGLTTVAKHHIVITWRLGSLAGIWNQLRHCTLWRYNRHWCQDPHRELYYDDDYVHTHTRGLSHTTTLYWYQVQESEVSHELISHLKPRTQLTWLWANTITSPRSTPPWSNGTADDRQTIASIILTIKVIIYCRCVRSVSRPGRRPAMWTAASRVGFPSRLQRPAEAQVATARPFCMSVHASHVCIHCIIEVASCSGIRAFLDRIACTPCIRCGLLLQMSHAAWSACLCVRHTGETYKNGWTGRDAVWRLTHVGTGNMWWGSRSDSSDNPFAAARSDKAALAMRPLAKLL